MTEIFRFGEKNCVRPIGYDWSSAVGGSAWSMSGGAGFKTRRSIMVFLKTFFFAVHSDYEQIELPAELLDYFLRSNKSIINLSTLLNLLCAMTLELTFKKFCQTIMTRRRQGAIENLHIKIELTKKLGLVYYM